MFVVCIDMNIVQRKYGKIENNVMTMRLGQKLLSSCQTTIYRHQFSIIYFPMILFYSIFFSFSFSFHFDLYRSSFLFFLITDIKSMLFYSVLAFLFLNRLCYLFHKQNFICVFQGFLVNTFQIVEHFKPVSNE